jgi:uncharacterized membrane protein
MAVYTDVDPTGGSGAHVQAISADGTTVAGYYNNSSGNVVGFVEDDTTGVYTDVSDPNGGNTQVDAISANGATVAGYYRTSSNADVGFVKDDVTGVYTDVSDPSADDSAFEGTFVSAISADGATLAGYYNNSSGDNVGFVETKGVYTDVSDPNGVNTFVNAISADGATVAGYYENSSNAYVGFVEDVATHAYTDVSDPKAGHTTEVVAISADGATVAGYYENSSSAIVGFVEDVATHVYTDVSDPNPGDSAPKGTFVTAISGDGATVAGYYETSSNAIVGFVEDVAAGVYTDVSDPSADDSAFRGTRAEAISADGTTVAGYYTTSSGDNVGFIATDVACYGRGASILTDRGEAAVENLTVGDLVVTASGEARPIKWIGRREVDCARHPEPKKVWPIRVSAGAFGEGKPSRDLWLSPGHNIEIEGVLAPISALVNGKTVAQIERSRIEYWHLELEQHDIIFAEGLPAETYLDTGNRTAFVTGGAFIEAHPDFKPKHWAETCLPLVHEGPQVVRARVRLLKRLEELGLVTTTESDLHIIADGERIEPIKFGATRFAFLLPDRCEEIRLTSRTFIPAHNVAESADPRLLGVCVGRLQIDGEEIALNDAAPIGEGWRDLEPGRRWTQGEALLPANSRLVVIDLAGDGHYWQALPTANIVALDGSGGPLSRKRNVKRITSRL